ncbi:MAG TPA: cytochrome c3 family protein [Phycisphaerae bacterium]|nr:cytochrome c3 family protein [Phycisphaerae bacterium]
MHPLTPFFIFILILIFISAPLTACNRSPDEPASSATKPAPILPAPKPTAPVPATASCATPVCHARFLTAAHIHGPVSANTQTGCFACHQQDQGNHTYPLARTGNDTCTFCHTVSGTQAHQHKALTLPRQKPEITATTDITVTTASLSTSTNTLGTNGGGGGGGCLNCHNPHASNAKFLLVTDTIDALCVRCHDVPLKKFAHQPFAAGQCTVCHQPHQSQFAKLLRNGDGPEHCFGCHLEKREALSKSPHIHKPAAQGCLTTGGGCHGPHATDFPKQLAKSTNDTCITCHTQIGAELASAKHVHGAVTQGNCASCHDPHASQQPNDLKERTTKLCLTCHDKALTATDGRNLPGMSVVLASANLHGPVKTGDCSACHLPHAANEPNLLKQYFPAGFYANFDLKNYALCFSCHEKNLVLTAKTTNLTNFRDGDKNLHFIHVNRPDKGRTCKTCHEIHGSDLPKHIAASVPFEGSTWAMPINYQQTPTGGSCSPGCHSQRSYDRNKSAQTQTADRGAP